MESAVEERTKIRALVSMALLIVITILLYLIWFFCKYLQYWHLRTGFRSDIIFLFLRVERFVTSPLPGSPLPVILLILWVSNSSLQRQPEIH